MASGERERSLYKIIQSQVEHNKQCYYRIRDHQMKTVEQHGNDKLCYIKQNAMLYLGEVGYSLKSKAQKKT